MKKIISILVICSALSSCTKVYNLSERLSLDVSITDSNNTPLAQTNVDVLSDGYSTIFSLSENQGINLKFQPAEYDNDLISFAETNSEGKARLHFPTAEADEEFNNYAIVFSKEEANLKPLTVFLQFEDFQNYYLEIPPQKIYADEALIELLITTDLDENYRLEEYSLTGNIAYDYITTNEFSSPKKFTSQAFIDVEKNQNILLNYSLSYFENGINTTINEEVVIEIGNGQVEYSIQNP